MTAGVIPLNGLLSPHLFQHLCATSDSKSSSSSSSSSLKDIESATLWSDRSSGKLNLFNRNLFLCTYMYYIGRISWRLLYIIQVRESSLYSKDDSWCRQKLCRIETHLLLAFREWRHRHVPCPMYLRFVSQICLEIRSSTKHVSCTLRKLCGGAFSTSTRASHPQNNA